MAYVVTIVREGYPGNVAVFGNYAKKSLALAAADAVNREVEKRLARGLFAVKASVETVGPKSKTAALAFALRGVRP